MNDEMTAHTFVVESMTVETGRIIPSKQVAEQAIAGMTELVRELNELRQFKASVPWSTLNHCELILTSYNRLIESVDTKNRADEMREWLDYNTPKPRPTTEQLQSLIELIRKA